MIGEAAARPSAPTPLEASAPAASTLAPLQALPGSCECKAKVAVRVATAHNGGKSVQAGSAEKFLQDLGGVYCLDVLQL